MRQHPSPVSICLLTCLLVVTCGFAYAAQPAPDNLSAVVAADNALAFHLFPELWKADQAQNIFISPTSLAQALSMTYNGAAGKTKSGMAEVLGVQKLPLDAVNAGNAALRASLQDNQKSALIIANALWAQAGYKFLPGFLQRNKASYGAKIATVDFSHKTAALKTINDWVAEQTRKKIPAILFPPDIVPGNTELVLTNAIYFKGDWSEQFNPKITKTQPFFLANAKKKSVPMMTRVAGFPYFSTDTFQAVALPYTDRRTEMQIFLPTGEHTLADIVGALTPETWAAWQQKFQPNSGNLSLPRFTIGYSADLNKPLKALGMADAFTNADFSAMDGKHDLYISLVRQKTTLNVNEAGSEATAATAVVMMLKSMPPRHLFTMVIDHPFFCAIRDKKTSAILFMGTIVEPQ